MLAHRRTPYITPGMDFPSGKGVVRGRTGQQGAAAGIYLGEVGQACSLGLIVQPSLVNRAAEFRQPGTQRVRHQHRSLCYLVVRVVLGDQLVALLPQAVPATPTLYRIISHKCISLHTIPNILPCMYGITHLMTATPS